MTPPRETWTPCFVARRDNTVFPTICFRIREQPLEGFPTVKHAMDWLKENDMLGVGVKDAEGIMRYPLWGDPFCVVQGSRDDPWEPDVSDA